MSRRFSIGMSGLNDVTADHSANQSALPRLRSFFHSIASSVQTRIARSMRTPFADAAGSSDAASLMPCTSTHISANTASHATPANASPQAKPFTFRPPSNPACLSRLRLKPIAASVANSGPDGRSPIKPNPKYQNARQQKIAPNAERGRNANAYTIAIMQNILIIP